jgi:hypothetical protein
LPCTAFWPLGVPTVPAHSRPLLLVWATNRLQALPLRQRHLATSTKIGQCVVAPRYAIQDLTRSQFPTTLDHIERPPASSSISARLSRPYCRICADLEGTATGISTLFRWRSATSLRGHPIVRQRSFRRS